MDAGFVGCCNLLSKREVVVAKHETTSVEWDTERPKRVWDDGFVSEAHNKNLFPKFLINLPTSKKAAFTLAEVLITLGIIGVVAAMTIPTLISSYKKRNIQRN